VRLRSLSAAAVNAGALLNKAAGGEDDLNNKYTSRLASTNMYQTKHVIQGAGLVSYQCEHCLR